MNSLVERAIVQLGAAFRDRLVQIEYHNHPELRRHAGKRNKAHGGGYRQVVAQQPEQPDAADQRKRQSSHNQQSVFNAAESDVKQDKDNHQGKRQHDFQLRGGALEVLILPGPGQRDAFRQPDPFADLALHFINCGF